MFFKLLEKLTTRKKMYSRLTNGWNKSQITICHVKIWTTMFFKLPEKLTTGKKTNSRLTDGWNKSQITFCCVKIRTHQFYDWKYHTYDRNKKRYNNTTVIWSSVVSKYKHQQSHFNLRKFLLGFFILQIQWDQNFLLLCISFLLCMDLQPYSNDSF
jgi:hypothetical protein